MGEQATLRIDTPLGAGAKRALEGNYPRPQPEHYSVSTGHRIVHGHNKPTGVKAWHLFLDPLDKTKAGALEVEFPDDSTVINLFVEEHNLQFPEPSYSCKVNFRIKWRKIRNVNRPGSINVASEMELLPEDAPVSELVKEFPRTSDGQPITLKKQHETDPAKCLHAMPAHVKREHDLDDNATGQAIRAIFGEPLPDAIRKRGAVLCWKMIEDYDEANKPGEVKARFAPPAAPPAPENGATTNVAPAPAISLPETKENVPVTISDGKTTPVSSGMSEAGFSMNFYWCDADGAETQFTMREATWQAGLANVEKFKAGLRALGYMPKAEYARKSGGVPVPAAAPAAPAPSNEGVADCVMVKVGKTFKGDKDQIVFECAGLDDAKYSSKDVAALVKITSGLRKLDGTPITALDLVNGNKIAVRGKVSWKRTDDGKYINVVGTIAA